MFPPVVSEPDTLPPTSVLEESRLQANRYVQNISYIEHITCINNDSNPRIDCSGLNFLQSPDSPSSSSGNFPENEPHSYEAPAQVAGFVQSASEEVPIQPPTQVANEAAAESMSRRPLRQLRTSFAHPTFILLMSGPVSNSRTLRDRFFSERPQSAQSAEEMEESS